MKELQILIPEKLHQDTNAIKTKIIYIYMKNVAAEVNNSAEIIK